MSQITIANNQADEIKLNQQNQVETPEANEWLDVEELLKVDDPDAGFLDL